MTPLDTLKNTYARAYILYWFAFDRDDVEAMKKARALMTAIAAKDKKFPFWPPVPESRARRPNPVPPSKKVQLHESAELYSNFTGHEPQVVDTIPKPDFPDVLAIIGDCDGIMYSTVRDGVHEKYIHKFHKDAKPLFCVNSDGTGIFFIGGEYDFTERGIVDRTDPKQQE
jgi:hypothetical protein